MRHVPDNKPILLTGFNKAEAPGDREEVLGLNGITVGLLRDRNISFVVVVNVLLVVIDRSAKITKLFF